MTMIMNNFEGPKTAEKGVEHPQTSRVETGEAKRAHGIDIKTLGKSESVEMAAGAFGQGGKLVFERVILPPDRHVGSKELQQARSRYSRGEAETLCVGGKIFDEEGTLEEVFTKSYVELPDGSIRTVRVDARFPDGSSESMVRDLDAEGRIRAVKNIVDGKAMQETKYSYGSQGEVIVSEYMEYDESGKVLIKSESSFDASGGIIVDHVDKDGKRRYFPGGTHINAESSGIKFKRARAYGGFEDGA